MSRSGADLALLLLGGYRKMVDEVVTELGQRGHPDVRPSHEFAMRAIQAGADDASALGRRLAVSKQAAAKTIAVLVDRGYVARRADPRDARRNQLEVTPRGVELMRLGEQIFEELRDAWAAEIGGDALALLEEQLARLVGDAPVRIDAPGWVAREPG